MPAYRRVLSGLADGVADLLAPVFRRLGIRFIHLPGNRIGECGVALNYYVHSTRLGWAPPARGGFVPYPTRKLANPCYLGYWRKYLRVVTNPALYSIAFRLAQRTELRYPTNCLTLPNGEKFSRESAVAASQIRWDAQGRPPLLALESDHERKGRQALAALGMPSDSWFVALHVREAGYLGESSDSHRATRNADIHTYFPAVRRIVERGGWVVRIGDPTMTPIPEIEHVIDYVHTEVQSDWMDVFLGASCRFLLGTSSGAFVIPWSFGRPVVLANWETLRTRPWGRRDLFIPKLWRLTPEGRFLTFEETLAPSNAGVEVMAPSEALNRHGVALVDNTAEEIVELVEEWFDREASPSSFEADEPLQQSFERLVAEHFPYGTQSRIGSRFLSRHRDLLPT